jgi:hypothetical protein
MWNDADDIRDKQVLMAIMEKYGVSGDDYRRECVEVMYKFISKSKWQSTFKTRHFVFSIFYGLNINIVDIRASLYLQAVDAMYAYLADEEDRYEESFEKKIKYLFERVYGHKMQNKAAIIARITRNNIMHTGSIAGNGLYPKQDKSVEDCLESLMGDVGQSGTRSRQYHHFVSQLNYLIADMVMRVMGLKWEYQMRNLTPPSRNPMFCRTKDLRNDLVDFKL